MANGARTVLFTAGNGNQARAGIPRLAKAGMKVRAMRRADRPGPGPRELGAFDVAIGDLGFTIDSGAYYVQTNMGGAFALGGADPSIAAYRANAAAAKYSRVVAAELFGDHRSYGYLYGGSGGAYQTLGGAEHTSGVWDGFMPYVLGSNSATPSVWTVRLNALRVLR